MDTMTILGVVFVLIGIRIIVILNGKESMRPTDQQIAGACERYRKHMNAFGGEQSLDAFCDSPYFTWKGPNGWGLKHDELMMDCVILATMYVEEHSQCESK